jgi:holo-ACP synthase
MWLKMSNSKLFNGESVNLVEMMMARDARSQHQQDLLAKYPDKTLITITMNIPGPVKNSEGISRVFEQGYQKVLETVTPIFNEENDPATKTGREGYVIVESTPKEAKYAMLDVEHQTPLRSLYDLDVVYLKDGKLRQVSRTQLGFPGRKCFICGNLAKVCARNRVHTIEEMQEKIERMIELEQS